MATTSYTHRIDPDLRVKSEAIYAALGMPLGTAINVFLRKSVAVGGFPFDVRLDLPTRETVDAMLEAEKTAKDSAVEAFSVEDALEELRRCALRISINVKLTARFKKDYKLALKRGYRIDLLDDVIRLIAKGDQQQKLIEE